MTRATSAALRETAGLIEALAELPRVRKRLTAKPSKFHDGIVLEISAADINGGETQGSEAFFHVPASLGKPILDAVEAEIRRALSLREIEP